MAQEVLLCAADKLAEAADTVVPLVWKTTSVSGVEHTIPPQATRDKFVARDAAMNMLAHAVRLGDYRPDPTVPDVLACLRDYALLVADPSSLPTRGANLFEQADGGFVAGYLTTDGDESQVVTTSNAEAVGLERLEHIVHIYRAGARLLRDLIEKNVEADLAGAEEARAKATDPSLGLRRMWGREGVPFAGYNSRAHALSTLFGRLELGVNEGAYVAPGSNSPSLNDPTCGGYRSFDRHLGYSEPRSSDPEIELLPNESNSLITRLARSGLPLWLDTPPSSAAQARAAVTLTDAGILIDDAVLAAYPADDVAGWVREQLLLFAALQRGFSEAEFDEFRVTDIATRLRQEFDDLAAEDITFGLRRNLRTLLFAGHELRLDGQSPGDLALQLGLELRTRSGDDSSDGVTDDVSTHGDVVLGAQLTEVRRDALSVPGIAQASDVRAASQCDTGIPRADFQATTPFALPAAPTALQNPFMLSYLMVDRLEWVGRRLAEWGVDADVIGDANLATAELRSWGARTVVYASIDDTSILFYLVRPDPEDFGQETVSGVANSLGLVTGDVTTAQCVAGLRKGCPDYSSSLKTSNNWGLVDQGTNVRWTTSHEVESLSPDGTIHPSSDARFYLIALPRLDKPGRILAAFEPRIGARVEAVSNLQDELADRVFGMREDSVARKTCRQSTAGVGEEYCIPGLRRDFFVPLANELTTASDGQYEDSWKHYLELARAAADRTDALGREVMDIGLQRDLRREGAQEELAEICGSYSAAPDTMQAGGGELLPSSVDSELNQCLNADTYDVVVLGPPFEDTTNDGVVRSPAELVRDYYCPLSGGGADSSPAFCFISPSELKVAFLNLATQASPQPGLGVEECEDIVSAHRLFDTAPSHAWDDAKLNNAITGGLTSPARLAQASDHLKLVIHAQPYGWELQRSSTRLMGAINISDFPTDAAEREAWMVYPMCANPGLPLGMGCDPTAEEGPNGDITPGDIAPGAPPCCRGVAAQLMRAFNGVADSDVVRARVENALWHIGAIAGKTSKGAFRMPVPVANFTPGNTSITQAYVPAVYSHGRFLWNSTTNSYDINPGYSSVISLTEFDRQELSGLSQMPSQFAQSRDDLGPAWSRELFQAAWDPASAQSYLYKDADSDIIDFNDRVRGPHGEVRPRDEAGGWLVATITAFRGVPWEGACAGVSAATRALQSASGLYHKPELANGYRSICGQSEYGLLRDNRYFDSVNRPGTADDFGHEEQDLIFYDKFWVNDSSGHSLEPYIKNLGEGTPYANTGNLSQVFVPSTEGYGCVHYNDRAMTAECAANNLGYPYGTSNVLRGFFAGGLLRPEVCPASKRVELFVNHSVDNDCRAKEAIADALLLGCVARQNPVEGGRAPLEPPVIGEERDLEAFEAWLSRIAGEADLVSRVSLLLDVPRGPIDDFIEGRLSGWAVDGGSLGSNYLELGDSLRSLSSGWQHLASTLRRLRRSVDDLRLKLDAVRGDEELADLQLALQRVEQERQYAVSVAGMAGGMLTSMLSWARLEPVGMAAGMAHAAEAGINVYASSETFGILSEIEDAEDEQAQNAVMIAIAEYVGDVEELYLAFTDSVAMVEDSVSGAYSALNKDKRLRGEAAFQTATAAGVDFATLPGAGGSDESVALPVNTVLRRQYNVARKRYERSLRDAKRLAYIARLAIEQRIGVRMADIDTGLGTVEPPSQWADQVCSLQGIDYDALRTALPDAGDGAAGTPGTESPEEAEDAYLGQFADAFIGDYVTRLENFIEAYNINAPFREADDRVVISLRDDVLSGAQSCYQESQNELYRSDALDLSGSYQEAEPWVSFGGWRVAGCVTTDDTCLVVSGAAALRGDADEEYGSLVPPGGVGGASWLREVPAMDVLSQLNASGYEPDVSQVRGPVPERTVYQTVELTGGTEYELSWWDMPLTGDGIPSTEDGTRYRAIVRDSVWEVVASAEFVPSAGVDGASTTWGDRRSMLITPYDSGTYHVMFSAAAPGESELGSLAIANVQLAVLKSDSLTSKYESTAGSRTVATSGCRGSAESFRAAFEHKCEDGRCFYETKEVFDLGVVARAQNSPLSSRVSVGNFNYRHMNLALNVVGTGVNDCTGSPEACYGNASVQYDLTHSAHNAGLEDYSGEEWCFNFEEAAIRGGKALVAERFLTMPTSSADQSLIGGVDFTKPELRGRPLSGLYQLRIYDTPEFHWERVEDIQVALTYRYWSRVRRAD